MSKLKAMWVWLMALGLCAPLAVGCWDDAESIQAAVWSDDDARQAYVHLTFERSTSRNPITGQRNTRKHRHQIVVQHPDGTARQAVTGEREGSMGLGFYYMRQAGYVLIEVNEEYEAFRWDVIRLADGSSATLGRRVAGDSPTSPCDHLEALPSPDGSVIAVLERTGVGTGPADCQQAELTVRLVDGATLATVGTHALFVQGFPGMAWTPAGELRVWSGSGQTWAVHPTEGPSASVQPACIWPATTSSSVSADGVMIAAGEPNSDPIVVLHSDGQSCF